MGASAPSGTVTFLFTDIEGSTRLWEDDREAAGVAVRRHDAVMGAAIDAGGGYVFNTAGDSFAAAFGRAGDAMATAIEAQRQLTEERWPGPEIRVRMGLHTGEVEERDGDYFGPATNTAARVCAAGHGGQVLFTTAVDELVVTERVELGRHRLKDIGRPMSLYQAAGDGLGTEFPPVRSLGEVASKRRRRWVTALAAAVVIGAAAAGLVLAGGSDGDSRQATPTTRPPPTPELVDTIEVGNAPVGLAQVPGDGAIWVSNQFDGTVSRIDPGTYEVTETVSVGSRPGALLPSVGGVLNVVHPDAVIEEVRLFDDNAVATVLDLGLDLEFGTPHADGEGGFWITDAQAGELLRVGLSSGEILARIPVGSAPGAVAAGEGAVWVTDADQAAVSRVDPVSYEVTATIPVGAVGGVTTGHGSVWAIGFEEGMVTRIDAETNEVVAEIPSVARASFGFFVSEDAVWYSSSIDNIVSRIDPLTNNVTTMDVGDQPYGLIVADGALWVTNRQQVRVERYEPAS